MRTMILVALLLGALAMTVRDPARLDRVAHRAPSTQTRATAAPRIIAAATMSAEPASADPLTTLPPEDIEWVLDFVERTESVRVLDDAQRARLIAQLVSVRMHDVVERTETYVAEVEP